MPVLMEQCEWCAKEVINVLGIYIISAGQGKLRICQDCRYEDGVYRTIIRYLAMCGSDNRYNIYTNKFDAKYNARYATWRRASALKG